MGIHDGTGFKYQNYASKIPRQLFGRPDWKCDKCPAVFSGYEKLRQHKWEKHAYIALATAFGTEMWMSVSALCAKCV